MRYGRRAKAWLVVCLVWACVAGGVQVCSVSDCVAEDEAQGDVWDTFKDVAKDEFYGALNDQFTDLSGVDVNEKIEKIQGTIETAGKFVDYFDQLLDASPTRKADLEILNGLASGIEGITDLVNDLPEPGPSLAAFFTFYAQGIRAAVALMEKLSEALRAQAITAAEAGSWDFSLYPGAISDDEIAAIRRMKKQEQLAKRARARAAAKKAQLEAKKTQIQTFADTGYADFIGEFVREVQTQATNDPPRTAALDRKVREFKRSYNLVFETTDPRDAMEAQYSGELDELLAGGKTALENSSDYFTTLRNASYACTSAEHALNLVQEIDDIQSDASIRTAIAGTRSDIEELKGRTVTFGGEVSNLEGAQTRFGEIDEQYLGLKAEADGILADAQAIRAQAVAYKDSVLQQWEARNEEDTISGQTGIPCGISVSVEASTLGADQVTEVVKGYPMSTNLVISIPTVLSKQVLQEVEVEGEPVMRVFYEISPGATKTTAGISVDPGGVVSVSGNTVKGVRAGSATITVHSDGYETTPSSGLYTVEAFSALQQGRVRLEERVDVEVYRFEEMVFDVYRLRETSWGDYHYTEVSSDVDELDLFISDLTISSSRSSATRGWIRPRLMFEDPSGTVSPLAGSNYTGRIQVESSDDTVVDPVGWESFYVVDALSAGSVDLTFSIVDDGGIVVHSRNLVAHSNLVRMIIGEVEDPSSCQEGWWLARPGDMVEVSVVSEGNSDMSKYGCYWCGYEENPEADAIRLVVETTDFVNGSSENSLIFPIQANSAARKCMYIFDRNLRDEWPDDSTWERSTVFRDYDLYVKIFAPELKRLALTVRHEKNYGTVDIPNWFPDTDATPISMSEIHLFNWGSNGYHNRPIDVVEQGYFTDMLSTEVGDTFGSEFFEQAEAVVNPSGDDSVTLDWFPAKYSGTTVKRRAYKDGSGSPEIYLEAPAGDSSCYYNQETLQSINKLTVYVDEVELDHPYSWTLAGGTTQVLRLDAVTDGELADYEVVWSLEPDVGGLESEVTDFVQEEGSWYSLNPWAVPRVAGARVNAMVRKKETSTMLGGDWGDVEIHFDHELCDAIEVLRIAAGLPTSGNLYIPVDVGGDGRIGPGEAVYVLQEVSGIR